MIRNLFRKLNKENAERGSITIFLACILLPMIIAEATIFNLAGLIASKHAAIDTGKLASNSALTAYDHKLHERYGLIGVNEACADMKTSQILSENLGSNLLSYSVECTGSLSNDEIFEGQICDAMWANYEASKKLQYDSADSLEYYYDSLVAIGMKQSYDQELFYLYGDLQDILDAAYPYYSVYGYSSEEAESSLSDEESYQLALDIMGYCDSALARKNTLEYLRRDWDDELMNGNIDTTLRSVLRTYYDNETDLDDYFDNVQNIYYAMYYYTGSEGFYDYVTSGYTNPYNMDEGIALDKYLSSCSDINALKAVAESSYTTSGSPGSETDEQWKSNYNSKIMVNKGEQIIHLTMSGSDNADEDNGDYSSISPDDMGYETSTDNYSDVFTALDSQMKLMEDTTDRYSIMPEVKELILSEDSDFIVSEYATEFFGSYHRTDNYSLTGGVFGTFGLGHTPAFSDVEYITYGMQSARDNCEQFKSQIFYTQYAGHLIDHYISDTPKKVGVSTGPWSSGGVLLNVFFKDDVEALVEAQDTAGDDINEIYANWTGVRFGLSTQNRFQYYTYAHYMKLFMLMSVAESKDAVLERMKYVINTNMASIENNFSLDNTYAAVTIKAKVKAKGVFGNETSFDYNTFAMY